MRWFSIVILAAVTSLWAQQMVVPEELNPEQARLYRKLAESVSAPCCNNGAPVAYHESGMAGYIKDVIRDGILAGKSEAQIVEDLENLSLGQDNRKVVFTVPEDNWLGWATWATPALMVALGFVAVFYFLNLGKRRRKREVQSDESLIEAYRPHIMQRLQALEEAESRG